MSCTAADRVLSTRAYSSLEHDVTQLLYRNVIVQRQPTAKTTVVQDSMAMRAIRILGLNLHFCTANAYILLWHLFVCETCAL